MSERAKVFLEKKIAFLVGGNLFIVEKDILAEWIEQFLKESLPTQEEFNAKIEHVYFPNTPKDHSRSIFWGGYTWCRDFVREEPEGELQCSTCKYLNADGYPCTKCGDNSQWQPKEKRTCNFCGGRITQHGDSIEVKEEKICRNCKYNDIGGFNYPCNRCKSNGFWERGKPEDYIDKPQSDIEKLEAQIHEILKGCTEDTPLEEILDRVDKVAKPKNEKWKDYGFPTMEEWVDSLHESIVDAFKQISEIKNKIHNPNP